MVLLPRIRWLNRRLEVAHARVGHHGLDVAEPALLYAARCWLDAQDAMSALRRLPELPEVAEMRSTLRGGQKLVTAAGLNRDKGDQADEVCGNHFETH